MTSTQSAEISEDLEVAAEGAEDRGVEGPGAFLERIAFWFFIAVIAWAPFPLGSNRPWSWSLLGFLISLCWLLWFASVWNGGERAIRLARRLRWPLILGGLGLAWAVVQILPWVPLSWVHPIWPLASGVLDKPLPGTISMDPWRTSNEIMKLGMYVMAAWLSCIFARNSNRALLLWRSLIFIGAGYALYALALAAFDVWQYTFFYPPYRVGSPYAGPFVSHNSFATYAGLMTLVAGVRLIERGSTTIVTSRGLRPLMLTALHFLFSRGWINIICVVLGFVTVIACASRAGFVAMLVGIAVLLLLGTFMSARRYSVYWGLLAFTVLFTIGSILFLTTGDNLAIQFDDLVEAGGVDQVRLLLWNAALRMIGDASLLGMGLGTFEASYPLYAERLLRFVMDKAHNDWLEFAAGMGLPAAFAWWSAWGLLVWRSARAVFVRRRHRAYPLMAVGATALVAFHSAFDFSLQIPAVALTYAVILGLGVGQSFSSRDT